jgi:hypothetical protein
MHKDSPETRCCKLMSAFALILAALNVCVLHMVGLQNKYLELEGACREVCSYVVRQSIAHSAPALNLAPRHHQNKSRAHEHQQKSAPRAVKDV